jgi:mannose-6-phosphate isomerase
MDLVLLPANLPSGLIYRGGGQIASFRGLDGQASDAPQDWIASTVAAFGESSVGLTMLEPGRSLADEIAADPVGWLGAEHVARSGSDTKILVKLLDAGRRLPVHVHPDDEFARQVMGRPCGKTEAWFMLAPATVHVGFSRPVEAAELAGWVEEQDVEAMLGALNQLKVPAGASVVVPAGQPHVIGEGAFLVELQQPTDLSILMEWQDFATEHPGIGHLGLGFDTALQAVDREALEAEQLAGLVRPLSDNGPGVRDVLAPAADGFFRLQRVVTAAGRLCRLDAGYSVLVVLSGRAELSSASGQSMWLNAGDTVLVAHRAGPLTVDGDAVVLRCRPPKL